jgi:hypothetical protein
MVLATSAHAVSSSACLATMMPSAPLPQAEPATNLTSSLFRGDLPPGFSTTKIVHKSSGSAVEILWKRVENWWTMPGVPACYWTRKSGAALMSRSIINTRD